MRCCEHGGCPPPLSALSYSPFGQAHAKHAHRWIPPARHHCPGGEPPERGPQTSPRHTFLILKCTEEGQEWGGGDGWQHLRDPDALPPGVCVWVVWAGKAAAWDTAHPRQCPGHKRGRGRRVKRRTIVGIEGVAGAGAPHPSLCGAVGPFRAGPRKTRSPMDPPGKASVPHGRTTRARAPNTPRISALEERATSVVARRGWPSPHNHHHIAPPSPTSFI